ncbi:MAG: mechanosensitive ion channel protein MscS [Owenweeksia sp.]|nr:mechanosensitive ion channel protein MscS [Owenweeksia sp.]
MDNLEKYWDSVVALVIAYGGKILLALIVLFIGLWLIKRINKIISHSFDKREMDPSLKPFLKSIIDAALKILLVITVASMVGVEMTSFVAILGAAGLAVGLALQGSLSNFAGGVLILILKPFKVGDFIEGAGQSGTVREIHIFYTYLTTPSGQEVIVPNGDLSNDSIKNYSFNPTRRFDMTFGIGYNDDIDKAKDLIRKIAEADGRFLEEQGITLFVEELADSSVNIHLRGWLNNGDFWDVYNNFNEKVKKTFDANGVSIPFPQRDVHFFNEGNAIEVKNP